MKNKIKLNNWEKYIIQLISNLIIKIAINPLINERINSGIIYFFK